MDVHLQLGACGAEQLVDMFGLYFPHLRDDAAVAQPSSRACCNRPKTIPRAAAQQQ
jgi:hypothetical protein